MITLSHMLLPDQFDISHAPVPDGSRIQMSKRSSSMVRGDDNNIFKPLCINFCVLERFNFSGEESTLALVLIVPDLVVC
jgi:hypothetical protein